MTSKKFDHVCLHKEEVSSSLSPWANFQDNAYSVNEAMAIQSQIFENSDDIRFGMNFAPPKMPGFKFS